MRCRAIKNSTDDKPRMPKKSDLPSVLRIKHAKTKTISESENHILASNLFSVRGEFIKYPY